MKRLEFFFYPLPLRKVLLFTICHARYILIHHMRFTMQRFCRSLWVYVYHGATRDVYGIHPVLLIISPYAQHETRTLEKTRRVATSDTEKGYTLRLVVNALGNGNQKKRRSTTNGPRVMSRTKSSAKHYTYFND